MSDLICPKCGGKLFEYDKKAYGGHVDHQLICSSCRYVTWPDQLEPPKICPKCGKPVRAYETGRILCESLVCDYEWFGYRQNHEQHAI